jgi:hypothetical protein
MGFLRKAGPQGSLSGSCLEAQDTELQATRPALHEFLTRQLDDDGNPRETATLLIFCQEGMFKGCLNDRATAGHLWAAGTLLSELLDVLEERLRDPKAEWRQSKEDGRTGRRK